LSEDSPDIAQLKKYARDLSEVYKSGKEKRKECEAARQQLMKYADALNKTISELKDSNNRLNKINISLKTLIGCNQVLVRSREESDLLHEICRVVVETGKYASAWVVYVDEVERKKARLMAQMGSAGVIPKSFNISFKESAQANSPVITSIRSGRQGYESAISLPLIIEDHIIGALNICSIGPDAFDEEEVKLFTELTADLSYGISALRTRAARKMLEGQLIQAQKMEAVGRLAGGVAHDFNNYLMAILSFGTIIRMNAEDGSKLKGYAEQIISASRKAGDIAQDLLTFSRKQDITLKPMGLNEAIERTKKLIQRVVGEGVKLEIKLSENELTVVADSGKLDQVLLNLATNAKDAMPEGGFFNIKTEPVELDSEFIKTYGYGKPGRFALLTVSDSGHGMNEETRKRIFEPFYTTKEIGKGTGLGLSVSYGIVKHHNGYIDVLSESGRGTSFNIYLPMVVS